MTLASHLALSELTVPAGAEWAPAREAWQVARLTEGQGFWLQHGQPMQIETGAVLIIPPGASGEFHASILSAAKLCCFPWRPEMITGILTAAERQFFVTVPSLSRPTVKTVPAGHELASRFALLAITETGEAALEARGRLLQLIGVVFREELKRANNTAQVSASAVDRFRKLMAELTDGDLIHLAPHCVAEQCGCSQRHFGRLFHEEFGAPFRAWQIQLRLRQARSLLLEDNRKIIDVALESGYRNLGLFNKMFKRNFGMTPSEWRRKAASPKREPGRSGARKLDQPMTPPRRAATGFRRIMRPASLPFLLFVGLLGTTLRAAEATNAAAVAASAPPAFRVTSYVVEGNTILSNELVKKILVPYTGEQVTLDTIRQGLSALQLAYHARGWATVKVGLPQQRLTNGTVQVTVTEGRLSGIVVLGNRHFSSNNVMRALPGLHTNLLLNSLTFQQELDRANANADRQISPDIAPGPAPGTTELHLRVKDRIPLHFKFEVNNQAVSDTPDLRLNSSVQYNNLWDREHQLGFQYLFTPEGEPTGYRDLTDRIQYFFDRPSVASYSSFYRMPLPGSDPQAQSYLGNADFGYDPVTMRFRPPALSGQSELIAYASRGVSDTGFLVQSESDTPATIPSSGGLQEHDVITSESITFNEDLGWRLTRPLPRVSGFDSTLSVGFDYKAFRQLISQNHTFGATLYIPLNGSNGPPFDSIASPPTTSSQHTPLSVNYMPFSVNWDARQQDAHGSTSLNIYQSFNLESMSASSSLDFAKVAQTSVANASGNYYILNVGMTRDWIFKDWDLLFKGNGQWANQTLIGDEQFGMGGLAGPRGYREGEEYGDTGWRLSLEPRMKLFDTTIFTKSIPFSATVSVFTDYGQRYLFTPKFLDPLGNPVPGPDRAEKVKMWGTGIALTGAINRVIDFRFALGFPLIATGASPVGEPRLYFGITAQF